MSRSDPSVEALVLGRHRLRAARFGKVFASTERTEVGCYTMTVNRSDGHAYDVQFVLSGGGSLRIAGIQTTWVPAADLPVAAAAATPDDDTDRNGN